MDADKQNIPDKIRELIRKYAENRDYYTSKEYNEENTKMEFINPFFEALGWDMTNKQQFSPTYKEVEYEAKLQTQHGTKAPDYSFRIGGVTKYYLEAKKPSVNIITNNDPSYQLRRYAWSKKLQISVLTNFETLAIYQMNTRPDHRQNPSIDRIHLYHYTEYIDKWDEICNILSKDAILTGKFDKHITSNVGKHGTSKVDQEFLKEIEQWRLLLARNIALRNKGLTTTELNYAVQLTIDRILFLRIAEDRGIERYGRLQNILKKDEIYKEFTNICREADVKYNSGLFHFTQYNMDDLSVDNYTLDLSIDNQVFKNIINGLYYPQSPYEFSVISPEILGKVYEQFLGKIIRLTKGHQARVDDKPEVKKAGGVYYTPEYIVDYIVEHTLGEKIKGKSPTQVSKLRVIDPACGSGSFLLRAYQYLLDYHLDHYTHIENPPKDVMYIGKDGKPRLTIREKKRILLNNIYGVDIDTLAVEVTKLSLLLKVLEDQNKDTLEAQQKLYPEQILPNLSDNIKNGNSIIRSDIINQQELTMDTIKKIKPFDWEHEFPETMMDGGFDVVIGNPPYVNIENIEEIPKQYYSKNYKLFEKRADLYSAFLELSLMITKEYSCFIIPSTIFSNTSYKKLRKHILTNNYLEELCYTGYKVFDEATVDTTIIKMNKKTSSQITLINALDFKNKTYNTVDKGYFQNYGNVLSIDDEDTSHILNKLFDKEYDTLENNFKVFQGIVTGNNPAYIFESEEDALDKGVDRELLHPIVYGKSIGRWEIKDNSNRILYVDKNTDMKKYPNTLNWLKNYRKELSKQKSTKQKWYQLHRPRVKEELDAQEKLLIQRTRNERLKIRTVATIDTEQTYCMESLYCLLPKSEYSLYFILPIINSNLINYLFTTKFLNLGIKRDYINMIHFPRLNKEEQKPFIDLSQKMINLHKTLQNAKTPTERKLIQQQIELTDKKINEKVYKLYDLTDEEIQIVENY